MRVDLPLDKKLWKIRIGLLGCSGRQAAGPSWALDRGPVGLQAAGPSWAVGRGPVFSKTLIFSTNNAFFFYLALSFPGFASWPMYVVHLCHSSSVLQCWLLL